MEAYIHTVGAAYKAYSSTYVFMSMWRPEVDIRMASSPLYSLS